MHMSFFKQNQFSHLEMQIADNADMAISCHLVSDWGW